MKRCLNCGAELDERDKFCPQCGEKCEEDLENTSAPSRSDYPMKWHNFLMVIMIISGVFTVISGFTTIGGMNYAGQGYDSAYIYSHFPGLKTADILYGAALIGMGVLEIIVRNCLSQFRESGPRMMKTWYIISIAVQVIYLAAVSSALKVNAFDSTTIGSLVATVLFMIINTVYYSHRSELFVN